MNREANVNLDLIRFMATVTMEDRYVVDAYVDGSFNKKTGRYSYGVVLVQGDTILHEMNQAGSHPRYAGSYQIAGECFGVLNAIVCAKQNKFAVINIFYDYIGIENWVTGEWRAHKPVSQDYVKYYSQVNSGIKINFIKVKAHSGNKFNDHADALAKDVLDIKAS